MKIEVHNRVSDFDTYRAARVKSLFNAESGCNFDLEIDGVDLTGDWNIGAVVGPSGSGKTSIGRKIFDQDRIVDLSAGWSPDRPIIDDILPAGSFNAVTGALAAVGLGDVPAWLRPFRVLSNGEQFRAGLARMICEKPQEAVVDEFTSVVDRQIAKVGAHAFQRSWRRENPTGKVVVLSPHYDILDWLQPDWVIDTGKKTFDRGRARRRPDIKLEIWKVDGRYWRYFEPHHYLKPPRPIAAEYYLGTVDGELVCHLAISPAFHIGGYRAARLVTMPEWQGLGIGTKFLEFVAQRNLEGRGRKNRPLPTYINTSHPQLCAALRRSPRWVQVSAALYGTNKARNMASFKRSEEKNGSKLSSKRGAAGFGGHFRAIQGFKYLGSGSVGRV